MPQLSGSPPVPPFHGAEAAGRRVIHRFFVMPSPIVLPCPTYTMKPSELVWKSSPDPQRP